MSRLIVVLTLALALGGSKLFGCGTPGEPSNCGIAEVSTKSERMAADFERDLKEGRLRERTNIALDAMIRFAAHKLRQKGYKTEAKNLLTEWESDWNGYIMRVGRKPGDQSHAPLSLWLQDKTNMMIFVLGIDAMKLTRLWDLVVVNESFRVIFQCIDDVNLQEFGDYFVPFSGVIAYWGAFISITAATWGTGFFFAGPISMGCEMLVVNVIAPKLNEPAWNLSCN